MPEVAPHQTSLVDASSALSISVFVHLVASMDEIGIGGGSLPPERLGGIQPPPRHLANSITDRRSLNAIVLHGAVLCELTPCSRLAPASASTLSAGMSTPMVPVFLNRTSEVAGKTNSLRQATRSHEFCADERGTKPMRSSAIPRSRRVRHHSTLRLVAGELWRRCHAQSSERTSGSRPFPSATRACTRWRPNTG